MTRVEQLREYRGRLDDLVEEAGLNVSLLVRRLRSLLTTQRTDGWDAAQEEGLVDSGCLSRLVTSPTDARVFRSPRHEPASVATHLANDPGYLDRHLDTVLARVESDGLVEVVGLGVGVDLSRHYRHGHVLDVDGPVDQPMLREVVDLLVASSYRRRPW